MRSHSIESLIPDLFKITRPVIQGTSPLIVSANLLHLDHVQMLPYIQQVPKIDSSTKMNMYATLGGYSVLNAILQTDPKDYSKLFWRPCQDFPIWIGSVKFANSLDDLLKVLAITNFGDAVVERGSPIPALITMQEILMLYRNNTIKSTLRVSEIGSEMVAISPKSTLIEALTLMFQRRIRRVFLTGMDTLFISDRHLIRFLFSPIGLERAQKDPEHWVEAELSEIDGSKAGVIHDGHVIDQAAREIGDNVDDCLVCETSKKVVSRWDIVMKPWKTGNASFA